MKPTKMRNKQIYRASHVVRSQQLGASLSKDLRKKHERRSVRVVIGDTVRVTRGEYKDVEGKVSKVDPISSRIAVEGVKKEKGQGEKFDVMIHASNVLVTSLKTDDSWRMKKLKGEPTAPAGESATGSKSTPVKDTVKSITTSEEKITPPKKKPIASKTAKEGSKPEADN